MYSHIHRFLILLVFIIANLITCQQQNDLNVTLVSIIDRPESLSTSSTNEMNLPMDPTPSSSKPPKPNRNGLNNRPIIGILLLDSADNKYQYVGSNYVKYLESAGARVVPIFLRQPKHYYQKLLNNVNGLLLPSGMTSLTRSEYTKAADMLLEIAIEINLSGTYFPVWGICLGFQKILHHFTKTTNWLSYCNVENMGLSLDLGPNMKTRSRIFNRPESVYSDKIVEIIQNNPVATHHSKWCLNVSAFVSDQEISTNFMVVTTTTALRQPIFVSTIEHLQLPFYGTIWHPEKNQFEFPNYYRKPTHNQHGQRQNITNDWKSIQTAQYFANFFVNEARRNWNQFYDYNQEQWHLIHNYNRYRWYEQWINQIQQKPNVKPRPPPEDSNDNSTNPPHQIIIQNLTIIEEYRFPNDYNNDKRLQNSLWIVILMLLFSFL